MVNEERKELMYIKDLAYLTLGLTQTHEDFRIQLESFSSEFDAEQFKEFVQEDYGLDVALIYDLQKNNVQLYLGDKVTAHHVSKRTLAENQYIRCLVGCNKEYAVDGKIYMDSECLKVFNDEYEKQTGEWVDKRFYIDKEPNPKKYTPDVLDTAFANRMFLLQRLLEELGKSGLAELYDVNKDELLQYVERHSFDYQINYTVEELESVAVEAKEEYTMGSSL